MWNIIWEMHLSLGLNIWLNFTLFLSILKLILTFEMIDFNTKSVAHLGLWLVCPFCLCFDRSLVLPFFVIQCYSLV